MQVWHWKDLREFHQQEVNRAARIASVRRRSRGASVRPRVARLSDDPYETMQFSENGAVALAKDEGPYAAEYMSGRPYRDVYRVDVATGKRDKILTKSSYGATIEPERALRAVSAGRPVVVARSHDRRARESHGQDQERRS